MYATKTFMLAASACITMILGSVFFFLLHTGILTLSETNYSVYDKYSTLALEDCYRYDGKELTGDELRYFVKTYSNRVFMRVITKKYPESFISFGDVTDKESKEYVPLNSIFIGKAYYTTNNVLAGMSFYEQGARLLEFDTSKKSDLVQKEKMLTYWATLQAEGANADSVLASLNSKRIFLTEELKTLSSDQEVNVDADLAALTDQAVMLQTSNSLVQDTLIQLEQNITSIKSQIVKLQLELQTLKYENGG